MGLDSCWVGVVCLIGVRYVVLCSLCCVVLVLCVICRVRVSLCHVFMFQVNAVCVHVGLLCECCVGCWWQLACVGGMQVKIYGLEAESGRVLALLVLLAFVAIVSVASYRWCCLAVTVGCLSIVLVNLVN